MNLKAIYNILAKTLLVEAALMVIPLIISFIYKDGCHLSFIIPIAFLAVIGLSGFLFRSKNNTIYAKEGFVTVALVWVAMSVVGAVPFVISKSIPGYVDALFETVSGFTTTGASILSDVESLSPSILFWRSFTHWIGGMGVLVFILAILPDYSTGEMHLFKAESPGPQVGKLVSKIKHTARILYAIYFVLTLIEFVFLMFGGMSVFDSALHALATAGTGGFGIKNTSVAYYDSAYIDTVIAVFMFIFGTNFNVFYLILMGNVAKAFKSEEFLTYLGIVVVSTLLIALNILQLPPVDGNFFQALRYSFFQVTSISSSTGFSTADFDLWPVFSKCIIVFLMVVGACAGSTGGGLKVSRLIILSKSAIHDIKNMAHPKRVLTVRFEGQVMSEELISTIRAFFIMWTGLLIMTTLLISIEGYGDFTTNFTAALSCLGNIGPGLSGVGPTQNFGGYSAFSKILLSVVMLAGRLELFPMIILFSPSTWKKR